MTEPFRIKRENGVVFVDKLADDAFRKALMDGVPVSLRGTMREALAATPGAGASAHAKRYFGAEFNEVSAHASALASVLHRFLADRFALHGLLDWLTATGFGNDYRMIKVFYEWAKLEDKYKSVLIRPDDHLG